MTRFVCAALGCLLACIVAVAASHGPDIPPRNDDNRQLMRGRLVGVQFWRRPTGGPIALGLTFLIEESIADFIVRAPGAYLEAIVTDIELDPSILTSANYRDMIETTIGHSVHLGDSCLVITHWPGAHGKELLSIEPASPEAEARLRAENAELILWFRRLHNARASASARGQLGKCAAQIDHAIRRLQHEPTLTAEQRNELIDSARQHADEYLTTFAKLKTELASRMDELTTAGETTEDTREHSTLERLRGDLEEIELHAERDRSALQQRLRDASLEMLMPEPSLKAPE